MSDETFLEQFSSQYGWQVAPAKRRFRYRKEVNKGMRESHRLALTMKGVVDRSLDDLEGLQASDYSTYQIFEEGDLAFKLIDLENIRTSRVGLVPRRGIMSPAYIRLIPAQRDADTRFYAWFFFAAYFNNIFNGMGGGVRQNLTPTDLLEFPIPLPDLATQRQIADFLDRETARIDLLIEKKQRLVALLGEKLEDDILRAVTLGIDSDTELVPEDKLEWTSHRPKHWNLYRLKHFFRENTQYSSDGQETLFSLRMKEGLVPHNDVSDKEIPPSDLINYKKVFPGQIVMNRMRAAIGLFGLADAAGVVSPDYSIFDVRPNAHAAYFLRLFKTEPMMAAFRLLSKGLGTGHSGFMRLNADNFERIRVAVPDFEEQRLISDYVERRIRQIMDLQSKNEQTIDRLKEYRSALITAAVTGQIDVQTYAKSGTPDRRLDAIQEEMGA